VSDPSERSGPSGRGEEVTRAARVARWCRRNAYLGFAGAAILVLAQVVEFSPPEKVRLDPEEAVTLVGEAPAHEFSDELGSSQAVQLRATLRRYPSPDLDVGRPDPEVDELAQVLSQPVVTTILGMNASIDQTVRLERGDLEIDLSVDGTPRVEGKTSRGKPPSLTLEHEISVVSRRARVFREEAEQRTHVRSSGILAQVEEGGYRMVFSVDDHLFALDIEVHRAV
jgi:hypothetical protein